MPIVLFLVPTVVHVRRHGPSYPDYTRCKPWLRDEFQFRCVYCMFRERWERGGWRRYHIDHLVPQAVDSSRITDYDNLVYSCDICNQFKSDETMPSPCDVAYGEHYEFNDEGVAVSRSGDEGNELIELLGLNATASAYQTCCSDRTWVRKSVLIMQEVIFPRRLSLAG